MFHAIREYTDSALFTIDKQGLHVTAFDSVRPYVYFHYHDEAKDEDRSEQCAEYRITEDLLNHPFTWSENHVCVEGKRLEPQAQLTQQRLSGGDWGKMYSGGVTFLPKQLCVFEGKEVTVKWKKGGVEVTDNELVVSKAAVSDTPPRMEKITVKNEVWESVLQHLQEPVRLCGNKTSPLCVKVGDLVVYMTPIISMR